MKVTNISAGPRGLNTVEGTIMLEPGEAREVELSEAEAKIAKGTGWFSFDGEDSDEGGELDRDDLKKQADELGIDYARNISSVKLKELIDAKLAS
jgi:hypothetical protein